MHDAKRWDGTDGLPRLYYPTPHLPPAAPAERRRDTAQHSTCTKQQHLSFMPCPFHASHPPPPRIPRSHKHRQSPNPLNLASATLPQRAHPTTPYHHRYNHQYDITGTTTPGLYNPDYLTIHPIPTLAQDTGGPRQDRTDRKDRTGRDRTGQPTHRPQSIGPDPLERQPERRSQCRRRALCVTVSYTGSYTGWPAGCPLIVWALYALASCPPPSILQNRSDTSIPHKSTHPILQKQAPPSGIHKRTNSTPPAHHPVHSSHSRGWMRTGTRISRTWPCRFSVKGYIHTYIPSTKLQVHSTHNNSGGSKSILLPSPQYRHCVRRQIDRSPIAAAGMDGSDDPRADEMR